MKYILLIIALGALLQYQFRSGGPAGNADLTSPKTAQHHSEGAVDERTAPATTQAAQLVEYARLFYGVPYRYGSSNPEEGFDCSGFIYHVFTHFGMDVPRSSVDFTHVGTPIEVTRAAPGDLILFTGTNPRSHTVGHIGIVIRNDADGLDFIHASSGKSYSVTISPLEGYYEDRFVKVIRLV